MKRLSAILLTVILVFSLCSCQNSEAEARSAAEGFLNAFMNLDFETMSNYVDNVENLPEGMAELNPEKIMEQVPEEYQAYSQQFNDLANSVIEKFKKDMSYTINSTEKTDEGYVFNATVVSPDTNVDFEKILTDELDQDKLTGIITDLYSSGKISIASTEEEILDATIPLLFDMIKDVVAETELGQTSYDATILVKEIDGKWLVDTANSDF